MIQWAKPVFQLASQTPDFGVDRGTPILVVIPFSIWLGLSSFISFPLWARLKAQRAQKPTWTWLADSLAWALGQIGRLMSLPMRWMATLQILRAVVKRRPRDKTKTIKVERGEYGSPNVQRPPSSSDSTRTEHDQDQRTLMSGALSEETRISGESTIAPGSATHGMDDIEMVTIPPPPTHQESQ